MPFIETFSIGPNEFILLPKHSAWKPSADDADDALAAVDKCFDPEWLTTQKIITHTAKGRGLVYFFTALKQNCVLRHYYRGGLVAKLSNDTFMFQTIAQTRPYKELNLLSQLYAAKLNVPKPIAAKLKRTRFTYTADIITGTIPRAQELHEYILLRPLEHSIWQKIGMSLRQMHDLQACHYDINVKNVLLQHPLEVTEAAIAQPAAKDDSAHDGMQDAETENKSGKHCHHNLNIFLLDFDGCKIRSGSTWKNDNLSRFKRSLEKQSATHSPYYYDERCWESIEQGYHA